MATEVVQQVDPTGVDYSHVQVSWDAVTTYEDGSPMTVSQYEVHISTDGGNSFRLATSVPGNTTSAELPRVLSGMDIHWALRAVPTAGTPADLSDPVAVSLPALDYVPTPTTPVVASRLGVVSCAWDGLFAAGEQRPPNFDHVEVHMSADSQFTPNDSTLQGVLRTAGSVQVTMLPYGGSYWFTMRSVSVRKTASGWTDRVSTTVVPAVTGDIADGTKIETQLAEHSVSMAQLTTGAVGPDQLLAKAVIAGKIDADAVVASNIAADAVLARNIAASQIQAGHIAANQITADKIKSGTLDAFQITSPQIRSSAPTVGQARYEMDSNGIHFYDKTGATTIDLDAATGTATVTGMLRTGKVGAPRLEVVNQSAMGDAGSITYGGVYWYNTATYLKQPALTVQDPGYFQNSGTIVTLSTGRRDQEAALDVVLQEDSGTGTPVFNVLGFDRAGSQSSLMTLSNDRDQGSLIISDGPVALEDGYGNYIVLGPLSIGEIANQLQYQSVGAHQFTVGADQNPVYTVDVLGTHNYGLNYFHAGTGDGTLAKRIYASGPSGLNIVANAPNSTGTIALQTGDSTGVNNRLVATSEGVEIRNAPTHTGSANAVLFGSNRLLSIATSLSRFKLDQVQIPAQYAILDAAGKTWRDLGEVDRDPYTTHRVAGFVAEEMEALSAANDHFAESLLLRNDDGSLQGIAYDRVPAFLVPVIRDMAARIDALERHLNIGDPS